MIVLIESVVACLIFTGIVIIATRNRCEAFVNDYPPVITEKLRGMGMIAEKPPARKSDIIRKIVAIIIFAAVFALVLRFINGITGFVEGALTAYLLWLVVDWYDFLVIDVLCAPFDKFYRAANVSAFDRSAVWFHFKGSVKGMMIGIVFAPLVGLAVMIL